MLCVLSLLMRSAPEVVPSYLSLVLQCAAPFAG